MMDITTESVRDFKTQNFTEAFTETVDERKKNWCVVLMAVVQT